MSRLVTDALERRAADLEAQVKAQAERISVLEQFALGVQVALSGAAADPAPPTPDQALVAGLISFRERKHRRTA